MAEPVFSTCLSFDASSSGSASSTSLLARPLLPPAPALAEKAEDSTLPRRSPPLAARLDAAAAECTSVFAEEWLLRDKARARSNVHDEVSEAPFKLFLCG
eukprot:CAMPEP_0113910312 /NCGR_PEP_ID=MMETSP0780_2-20120614/27442_1 /TAXON_ID=652834 /ORGANISM="Palpitomonas bilix" /LENGTH=99 /DNA_ID=CAMNT_0000906427 /DNA_START=23 /DNA_END=322 /DNA_ORIENTATION=- /assembly_acc=CAM_ASM_000599